MEIEWVLFNSIYLGKRNDDKIMILIWLKTTDSKH